MPMNRQNSPFVVADFACSGVVMKWLDWLTRPVQKLFNLLSFRRKFSLIGFLLFIPVIVLSSLMVTDSLNKSQQVAEKQTAAQVLA
jgi:hypothetical protein